MEKWEIDFEWLRVQHFVKDAMHQETLPTTDTVLFLIGIQELGRWQKKFTKEEKTDLMHLAVCRLLSYEGVYEFQGRDGDGWPHWKQLGFVPKIGLMEQELKLKMLAIRYFKELETEGAG
jgi:hypothetical protein